jgi:hypothetical protein
MTADGATEVARDAILAFGERLVGAALLAVLVLAALVALVWVAGRVLRGPAWDAGYGECVRCGGADPFGFAESDGGDREARAVAGCERACAFCGAAPGDRAAAASCCGPGAQWAWERWCDDALLATGVFVPRDELVVAASDVIDGRSGSSTQRAGEGALATGSGRSLLAVEDVRAYDWRGYYAASDGEGRV